MKYEVEVLEERRLGYKRHFRISLFFKRALNLVIGLLN